jgi:hypothetical protein
LVLSIFALLVAASLIGAPFTMSDWAQQADFTSDPIEKSEINDEMPVLQYENLSNSAQEAVRQSIESPDGHYTIYGNEDFPDRFFYSDTVDPGKGMYVIAYENQYYRLHTARGGGFFFVYLFYQLPFIIYGVLLTGVAYTTRQGRTGNRTAALTTVPGIAFHVLGPEFDFPVLTPMQFATLGVLAVIVGLIGLLWAYRESRI